MIAEKQIRVHRLRDKVGVGFTSTNQLYLTSEDAKALGKELLRFSKNTSEGRFLHARIVENGEATTEHTGKKRAGYIKLNLR